MRIRFATSVVAALMILPAAWAQTGSAVAPAKVGILNVQAAIAGTAEGKQAATQLQAQFAGRQAELEQLSKDIDDIRTRLRNGSSTLSDDEKARLAQQGDQKSRMLQRRQQDLQDDGQEAQREVFDRIGRKMVDILDRYAKDNGYGVVVDSSAQSTTVVYASPQVDITQEIVRLYDQANPAKSASSASSTAAPRASAPARPVTSTPRPTAPPQ
jgi:outer membrane protein